jgi:hypothetical protein
MNNMFRPYKKISSSEAWMQTGLLPTFGGVLSLAYEQIGKEFDSASMADAARRFRLEILYDAVAAHDYFASFVAKHRIHRLSMNSMHDVVKSLIPCCVEYLRDKSAVKGWTKQNKITLSNLIENNEIKREFMTMHPSIKGAVLMNDLGL